MHLALFPDDEQSGAIITGLYRYRLWRTWDPSHPQLVWILLNPSTASGAQDDPTLRRLVTFSRSFGYGGLVVVNLFAWRASSPQALTSVDDPIGPDNDRFIREAAAQTSQIVVAWGNQGIFKQRDQQVLALLSSMPLFCLGMTTLGNPVHPLYQKRSVGLRPFTSRQCKEQRKGDKAS